MGGKPRAMQPPQFRLLAGSSWKKVIAGVAFAVFTYSVLQVVVLKKEDHIAAWLLLISFVVIFGLSISEAIRRRRELHDCTRKEPIQPPVPTRGK